MNALGWLIALGLAGSGAYLLLTFDKHRMSTGDAVIGGVICMVVSLAMLFGQ